MKNKKLVSVSLLKKKLIILKKNKKKIAFTNGCFDILHSGHIKLLLNSKKKSDILFVAVKYDKSYLNIKNIFKPYINPSKYIKNCNFKTCNFFKTWVFFASLPHFGGKSIVDGLRSIRLPYT